MDSLGIFIAPFAILVLGGFTLSKWYRTRRKLLSKMMLCNYHAGIANLNIEGPKHYVISTIAVTGVLKGGLERIQDDELDIESVEKGQKSIRS